MYLVNGEMILSCVVVIDVDVVVVVNVNVNVGSKWIWTGCGLDGLLYSYSGATCSS